MFSPGVGRRSRRVLGDFAVLRHEVAARRRVAAGPAEQLGRYAPVGALGVVFGSSASLGSGSRTRLATAPLLAGQNTLPQRGNAALRLRRDQAVALIVEAAEFG